MTWWRELGQGSGFSGPFSSTLMECAYCGTKGAFAKVFEQKRQLQQFNVLRYEAYQCNQCSNITFIIWGGNVTGGPEYWHGLHDFRQFPSPTRLEEPDHWPKQVASAYIQAEKALESESWDAAATMAGRAVQALMRQMLGESKRDLFLEIKELVQKQLLPKPMADWGHEVRALRNVGAHPDNVEQSVSERDAKDIVKFAYYLILYAIEIPHQIEHYRSSRTKS